LAEGFTDFDEGKTIRQPRAHSVSGANSDLQERNKESRPRSHTARSLNIAHAVGFGNPDIDCVKFAPFKTEAH